MKTNGERFHKTKQCKDQTPSRPKEKQIGSQRTRPSFTATEGRPAKGPSWTSAQTHNSRPKEGPSQGCRACNYSKFRSIPPHKPSPESSGQCKWARQCKKKRLKRDVQPSVQQSTNGARENTERGHQTQKQGPTSLGAAASGISPWKPSHLDCGSQAYKRSSALPGSNPGVSACQSGALPLSLEASFGFSRAAEVLLGWAPGQVPKQAISQLQAKPGWVAGGGRSLLPDEVHRLLSSSRCRAPRIALAMVGNHANDFLPSGSSCTQPNVQPERPSGLIWPSNHYTCIKGQMPSQQTGLSSCY